MHCWKTAQDKSTDDRIREGMASTICKIRRGMSPHKEKQMKYCTSL